MLLGYPFLKRWLDIVGALALLPLLVLAVLLLGPAIKLTSPGPFLYAHVRCGKAGRRFRMLKFRTMCLGADSIGAPVTTADDPRVTPLGRVLRKTKVDELPQLWNVLIGDMSLVGPRPQSPCYVLHNYPDDQRRVILSIRPGITGPTQIWCRNEEEVLAAAADPDDFYKNVLLPRKIASDVAYARNPNLLVDLRCLLLTLLVCLPRLWRPRPLATTALSTRALLKELQTARVTEKPPLQPRSEPDVEDASELEVA